MDSSCNLTDKAPSVPVISGPTAGVVGVPVTFKATATDPEGDSIAFQFDWGDSSTLAWTNLIASGETTSVLHTYADSGAFSLKAKAKDKNGEGSDWTVAQVVQVQGSEARYPDTLLAKVYLYDAWALTSSLDGAYIYLAQLQDNRVMVMRTSDFALVDSIATGDWPEDVALSPDGQLLYVANLMSDDVTIISTATHEVVATVPVGVKPGSLAFAPGGQLLYVLCRGEDSLAVMNTASHSTVAKLYVGAMPNMVAVTPDGTKAYVALEQDHAVAVVDLGSLSLLRQVTMSTTPYSVFVSIDGSCAYVGLDDTVCIMSCAGDTVLASVFVGGRPQDMAFSPDERYVYVANDYHSKLPVMSAGSREVIGSIVSDAYLGYVCLSPDGSRLYATDDYRGVYVYGRR
jgi:YVTN family beta-propeller protein